jgi:hypothetical protein
VQISSSVQLHPLGLGNTEVFEHARDLEIEGHIGVKNLKMLARVNSSSTADALNDRTYFHIDI